MKKNPDSSIITAITRPIQLFAVVFGIIVIALITASTTIVNSSIYLATFCLISAVAITIITFLKFIDILKNSPWSLFSPRDFGDQEYFKLVMNKISDYTENLENESNIIELKANYDPVTLHSKGLDDITQDEKNKLNEVIQKPVSVTLMSSYNILANDFESKIKKILLNLKVEYHSYPDQWDYIMPDYVIISPNGRKIPLEIKYYTKRLVGTDIPRKIVERMNLYLDHFETNEGIIIVSSSLSSDTIENMKKIFSGKLHIIQGEDFEKIQTSLEKIVKTI